MIYIYIYIYIHDTQSGQILHKQDGNNTCAIMKIMCPPGYYQNGFVATQALNYLVLLPSYHKCICILYYYYIILLYIYI